MNPLPRIIVAGQIPPPVGGQNAMILGLLRELQANPLARVEHLPFYFTKDTQAARKGGLGKLVELVRVIGRLLALRLRGPIDLMVFPPGGPQRVPICRDLLLLPWVLLVSRETVLHFHAAGIADALANGGFLPRCAAWLYGRCRHAVVMTHFNRRDPAACRIPQIHVVPHLLADTYDEREIERNPDQIRILAMGHLCEDKGTRRLIEAVGMLRTDYPEIRLELAGEPLAPYTQSELAADLKKAGLEGCVALLGVVTGEEKRQAFGRASLFAFPSTAPYESFGLVMAEALMWGLPIVASQWRGNEDVIGSSDGCILFSPASSAVALADGLRKMIQRREKWPELGRQNRELFLTRYHPNGRRDSLSELLVAIVNHNPISSKVTPASDNPATIFTTVVMATMNRSATVADCVRALALQTRPPDRVIVADNVSTDDTVEVLENLTALPFQLTVHRMRSNRGNAGGVEEAMALAFADGSDAVWILDDDSWPRAEALEKLLGGNWSPTVVRHAIQVCPGTSRLTWPMPVRDDAEGWKLIWSTDEIPAGDYLQTRASWTGALISRQIFDDVGPVNGELFIRGEDEEYPWRIEQAGYSFEAAVGATMDHPGPQNMIHWKFLGRSLFLERDLADAKLYYKVRNMVWLKRKQAGSLEAALMALAYLGGISLLDGPRRLPLLWHSIRHAFQGRLGIMKQ